jgi:hypothetical protein
MRQFISAIEYYESLSNPLPTFSGVRDQREIHGASGKTTVTYTRGCAQMIAVLLAATLAVACLMSLVVLS